MSKLITILIPTYNNYALFKRATRTYLNNSKVNIIVSDDSDDFKVKKSIELYQRYSCNG